MIYETNKTMKLLGKQYSCDMLGKEEMRALHDVYDAHYDKNLILTPDSCIDSFMLGYIYGKRAERQRKKGK